LEFSSREAQKLSANVAREMVLFIINQLIDVPFEIQHEAIGKFLNHSLLKNMVPPYLTDPGVVKHKFDVLQNMKEGINTHLAGCRKSKLVMVKDTVCTLTSSQSFINKRAVARVFGVDRQNIPRTVLRRAQLDTMNDVFWLNYKRIPRFDTLSEVAKKLVIDWWVQETSISPNPKDVI